MKYRFLIILLLVPLELSAVNFKTADSYIANILVQKLDAQALSTTDVSSVNCFFTNNEVNFVKLIACKNYLKETYVTDDIDSYLSYINQLVSLRVKITQIPEYSKVLSAEYDEVNSKLYFDIAKASYQLGDYEQALSFLKKIDDTLDEDSVYHALLIYGLVYFEKGNLKKAKYYLSRINTVSNYYKYSQYNLALISMRSSWWSEAEEHLRQAVNVIRSPVLTKEDEQLLDRAYLTLGYSQINRKGFRDAKNSFEKISLNSHLKYRALLGIAMCEIGLGNLSKAAPVLKFIMNKTNKDEYIDALVILPQVYHHADNIKLSVDYYNQAIDKLSRYNDKDSKSYPKTDELIGYFRSVEPWLSYEAERRMLIVADINNSLTLTNKQKDNSEKAKRAVISELKNHYSYLNNKMATKINDYIKQVKYSLAVIYDESVAVNE